MQTLFFFVMGYCYIAEVGLELWSSSGSPASDSRVEGTTGVYCAWSAEDKFRCNGKERGQKPGRGGWHLLIEGSSGPCSGLRLSGVWCCQEPMPGSLQALTVPSWPQVEESLLPERALSSGILPPPLQCARWELPGVCRALPG
jgi:hypothetical protein